MKNISKLAFAAAALAAALFFSCKKDLDLAPQLDGLDQPYALTSLDANGGDWKPFLLVTNEDVVVAPPADVTTSGYVTELAAVKGFQGRVSDEQKATINYWNGNGVARWMQIASDIMAKYNIPPAPNADGTYPVPSSSNPGVYPYFPFANPPYASRAYAYLGAAMFDAMIETWHYKYKFNRPAPKKNDAGILPMLPSNDLPSYPSEDAVAAAVARTVLSAMFPNEKGYLAGLAEEHKNTRLWAGANVLSDLTAGDALGTAVANKFIDRSKTDGMSKATAIGTAADGRSYQDSMANAAQTAYGWHWTSLDVPARPGLLAFFGRVKMWNVPGGKESVRPAAPPALNSDEFNRAAEEVKNLQANLTSDQRRIAQFWADGPGTYTPPGHWEIFAAQECASNKLNPLRTARVFAYLGTALEDAGISCWDTKYFFHYPRPSNVIDGFKTVLGVPNFPSYSSGHSTFSAAGATVLSYFFPAHAATFDTWAHEASESRIYGGIHYRFDCETGLVVGKTIGNLAVDKAKLDGGM